MSVHVINSRIDMASLFFRVSSLAVAASRDAQVKIDMKCQNKGPIQYIYSKSRARSCFSRFFTKVKFAKCHYFTTLHEHRRLARTARRYRDSTLVLAFLGALRHYHNATRLQQGRNDGEIFTNVAVADRGPWKRLESKQGPIARKPQVGDSPNLHSEQQGQSKA